MSIMLRLPLRAVLIIPFVVQIFAAVGLVGYFSFKNGQQSVTALVHQLHGEVASRVDQHLDTYLALPHQINALNRDAVDRGLLDLNDIKKTSRYFWQQSHVFPQLSYVGYALADQTSAGAGRWVKAPKGSGSDVVITLHPGGQLKENTYATDAQGNQTKRIEQIYYNGVEDIWYVDTAKAGKPIWSRVYTIDGMNNYTAASANTPIYDKNNKLRGVLSIDLRLNDISEFLHRIQVSPSGRAFILERNGQLIANSDKQPISFKQNGKTDRYSIANNPDPLLRKISEGIQQKSVSLQSIQSPQSFDLQIDNQRQYVQVTPWKDEYGLDWLVVVTIPESDFTTQINLNTRTTMLLCLGALLLSIVSGIFTSRWISKPILALNLASKAVANGDLDQQVNPSRIREFNAVGQSFNHMAIQLKDSFADLERSHSELEARVNDRTQALSDKNTQLNTALGELHQTQAQMLQSEKMSALGQMVAGVAHEINNPVNFIHGNLAHLSRYTLDLLSLVQNYQQHVVNPPESLQLPQVAIDLDFLSEDLVKLLKSMKVGTDRICEIVLSLRNFSRLDEADFKPVNLHDGIESTLLLLRHRLQATPDRNAIHLVQDYGRLPLVECYAGQLNQVFMNLFSNAIDAMEETLQKNSSDYQPTLSIRTECSEHTARVIIADNGCGITEETRSRIFDPFFTTKPVGKGTGLGLSISYQIITDRHKGRLYCNSTLGEGTKFTIDLPLSQGVNG